MGKFANKQYIRAMEKRFGSVAKKNRKTNSLTITAPDGQIIFDESYPNSYSPEAGWEMLWIWARIPVEQYTGCSYFSDWEQE